MIFFVALLTGVSIVIAMVQNAKLADYIGIKQCTVMNYVTGLTTVTFIFIILGASLGFISKLSSTHALAYFGGLMGIIVVTTSTVIIRKLSIIAATMLMYAGQLMMGIFIDYLRDIDLSLGKIFGCILIIAGVYFNTLVDQRLAKIPRVENTSMPMDL
ncbi:conserved membrane protein of unknown function [Petrocella atlantisensis]|uniref:EamA-like transporter family protein n=1 Tax=Petrocella atlantisensis TaxID=2173034 RepID=A0A3P7P1Z2_9FIRM|nr:DMT family transporter [Petrocella atlantisensis]VDN47510.1 conserved membrane protein of unknown function [Petrocella atlantisensis]